MYCPSCGEKNAEIAKFCHNCGGRLAGKTKRSAGAASVTPTTVAELKKQAVYICKACGHEGVANRSTNTPWRWYHYLTSLIFFPFGLWFTMSSTAPVRECASCHSGSLKRLRYELLPAAAAPTDPDTIRNRRHRRIAAFVVLAVLVLSFAVGAWQGYEEARFEAQTLANTATENVSTTEDAVLAAHYGEGYKAGYTDGRAADGEIGDSYAPPATATWREEYAAGYVDGFLLGCDEGGFDCSAIEDYLSTGEAPESLFQ